jgi:hypothetical protein
MAAKYRRIDPRIWTDEKFRQLTSEQQRVALYILTAQSNRIGFFSFSTGKACEDLETLLPTFRKGFLKVCQTLNWEWDPAARVLYLPTWWRYNPPENANNVIGNLKDLDDLPETPLLKRFSINTAYLSDELIETFTKTLAKRSPKRSPSQDQHQDQDQERRAVPPSVETADCRKRKVELSDEEFIAALKMNSAYRQVDVDLELGKLDAWLLTPRGRGKKKTRQRIVTWLNKAADDQREVKMSPSGPKRTCVYKLVNGDARHLKLCGKSVSTANGIESSHCDEHLAKHLEERRRIDAQLNRVTA